MMMMMMITIVRDSLWDVDEDDESSFPVLSPKASPTRNHPLDWTRHYVLALVSWFAPQNLDHPATSSHSSLEWRVDHVFGQWHDSSLSSPLCHCFSRPESSGRTMESCWVAKYRLGLARTLYLRCAARDHYHCGRSIVLHNSNLCLLEPPDFCFFLILGLIWLIDQDKLDAYQRHGHILLLEESCFQDRCNHCLCQTINKWFKKRKPFFFRASGLETC